MTDDQNIIEPNQPLVEEKPEKRKPGEWVAETVKDAKERLGINLLTFTPDPVLQKALAAKRGRKTTYNQEIADLICEKLLSGTPLAKVCAEPGMPNYTTVCRWEDTNEDFKAEMARSKRNGSHYIADDCIRIADDETIDPAHKRIMVDTRLRLIKSWHAKAYGDNLKLSGDENGAPVRFFIDGLSDRVK